MELAVWHIIVLAVVQGITEFLPVSSSGHLQLVGALTPLPAHSPAIDMAVHLGSLAAVLVYLRQDIARLWGGFLEGLERDASPAAREVGLLLLASLPVLLLAGLLVGLGVYESLRDIRVVAIATIVFAVPLYLADRLAPQTKEWRHSSWQQMWWIGAAQCFALLPGASRAGVVLTAARLTHINREQAVRLSFLLSIPVICALSVGAMLNLWFADNAVAWAQAGLALFVSAGVSFVSLWGLVALLRHTSLLPFVLYRLALGCALLYWL